MDHNATWLHNLFAIVLYLTRNPSYLECVRFRKGSPILSALGSTLLPSLKRFPPFQQKAQYEYVYAKFPKKYCFIVWAPFNSINPISIASESYACQKHSHSFICEALLAFWDHRFYAIHSHVCAVKLDSHIGW